MHDVGGDYQLSLFINAGTYRYKLVVDGYWIPDPNNPLKEPDPFGGENSLLIISETQHDITWEQLLEHFDEIPLAPIADENTVSKSIRQQKYPFLLLNRMSEDHFEWRFRWFKGLADIVIIHIGSEQYIMKYSGADLSFELFHYISQFCDSANVKVWIEIIHEGGSAFYGSTGLVFDPNAVIAIELNPHSEPVFEVPEWVSSGIIYQIFPDRFAIGNPDNMPDFSEWYYQDSRLSPPPDTYLPPQVEYFHLIQDWRDIKGLSQSPYLPKGKPDWWSFYGGDIAGITQKLDYLCDLGITIIYLNPLWQAKSNHKYDAADYMKIDPHFGTEEELQTMVKAAHSRGIRIILDVAFNHTGETFWAFRDCIEKGPFSEYWNWYDWHKYPLPSPLPPDFDPKEYYQCWWGIKDMPDLNYDLSRLHPDENYVKDIEFAVVNTPLVNYVLKTAEYWLVKHDLDGFRLDVPDEVPFWFWELFRREVKRQKADAWLVGEIWHNAEDWVNHRYFDSVMNYAYFKSPAIDYLVHRMISLEEFQSRISEGLAKYPIQALQAMMNLYGSHDTWRIIELAKGDIKLLKCAILFQMCFVGTPHIYYGDEIAMHGKKDPDNRRPFNWNWENRTEAIELRSAYKELIKLRKEHKVLQTGDFAFVTDSKDLCHFKRFDASSEIHIVLNNSKKGIHYCLPQNSNLLYATQAYAGKILPARSGLAFLLDNPPAV